MSINEISISAGGTQDKYGNGRWYLRPTIGDRDDSR